MFDELVIVMIALMGTLIYIARDVDPTVQPTPSIMQGETRLGKTEPEFLEVDILPPIKDEPVTKPPQARRLRD
jgi:hypothetical protein